MAWPLAWVVALGALPGVFIGAVLRVTYFSDPAVFKVFVGLVLLYLGVRLLYETLGRALRERADRESETDERRRPAAGETVRTVEVSWRKMSYRFGEKDYSFGTVPVFLLSLAVGVIGGIYSIVLQPQLAIEGGSSPSVVAAFGSHLVPTAPVRPRKHRSLLGQPRPYHST